MKLQTIFNQKEISRLQLSIIVEMWDNVMGTRSGKRKYHAAFSEKEQKIISEYYKIAYRWYYQKVGGSGTPTNHAMEISTYRLLEKAVHFFATV